MQNEGRGGREGKTIVEFRIPGCPGPIQEHSTKARLMQGNLLRKIQIYFDALYMQVKFYNCRSDGACRHVGAALINLEETLRGNSVVTCTGSKCMWKKKNRTHEEVTPVENMDFTKPTIGRKKKSTCKPRATIFDE